jgi:hypothetical protein
MKPQTQVTGTARYASINAHKKVTLSRRDDLEAIGYMFMYFLRGSLPWSGLEAKTAEGKFQRILETKEETKLAHLCHGFPKEFEEFLRYARNLGFKTKPDYDMLYDLLDQCREPDWQDHSYQWFENRPASEETTPLLQRTGLIQPDERLVVASRASRSCWCAPCDPCGAEQTRALALGCGSTAIVGVYH